MISYHQHQAKKIFSAFLPDSLFSDKKLIQNKLCKMLEVFCVNCLSIRCDFFNEEDKVFLNEIERVTKQQAKILIADKERYRMSIEFRGELLNDVIKLAIKHEEPLGIDCLDELGTVYVQLDLYDNDGSCVNFNIERYDVDEITNKFNMIF